MNDFFSAIGTFLAKSWDFFKIPIPVLGFPFGALLVGAWAIDMGLRLLTAILGMGFGGLPMLVSTKGSYRNMKARQAKISKERQHDEK